MVSRGSIYTTIMELGPQNHNGDGLLGPDSIIVVYMDPLGLVSRVEGFRDQGSGLVSGQSLIHAKP